ncbi:MAG TPA: 4Fe-4S dicluster-binding protein [Thermoplasmata archaeon]|nr:4Fe-4S dicluster-binding protein [Thermoplasmata archaeon]
MAQAAVAKPAVDLDYYAQVRQGNLKLAEDRYKKHFRARAMEFIRGKGSLAVVSDPVCMGCTHCFDNCAFEAIDMVDRKFTLPELTYTSRKAVIITENCVGCEKCAIVCPVDAITMIPKDGWDVRDGRLVQVAPPPSVEKPYFQPPKPGAPRPPVSAEPFVAFREEEKKAAAAPKPAPPKPAAPAAPAAPSPTPTPPSVASEAPPKPAAPAATRVTLTPDEVKRLREEARKKALAARAAEGEKGTG